MGRTGLWLALALAVAGVPAHAAPRPAAMISSVTHRSERLGQCFHTRVLKVETRLAEADGTPAPESGSAIEFADGHYNVDYGRVPGIDSSRPGDRVRLCVRHLPTHCPSGDTRGINYRVTNLRTGRSWIAPDAEHLCGGA